MSYTYNFHVSSASVCRVYKRDEEENQSTFEVFVMPKKDGAKTKSIFCFVVNEEIGEENYWGKDCEVDDVFKQYTKWYDNSNPSFDLEAKEMIRHCIGSQVNPRKTKTKKGIGGKLSTNGIGIEGEYSEEAVFD